ncbi:MAG TPA: EF-hand domain-containing protein [Verrucomicrobiae bacterium]|nr:EF-hand domain-containing protein [Verrucomicrobiae bacterium]
MKKVIIVTALAVCMSAFGATAQDEGGPPPFGGPDGDGRRPSLPLVVTALDANHDGVIDSNEIANASAALKTLDKNGDGKLTPDEFMGPRPGNMPPDGMDGHRPPAPAIVRALDANHDGVIDSNEIANASAALKTLDKNGDGKLTPDEFMGPRPDPPTDQGDGGPMSDGNPDGALNF